MYKESFLIPYYISLVCLRTNCLGMAFICRLDPIKYPKWTNSTLPRNYTLSGGNFMNADQTEAK